MGDMLTLIEQAEQHFDADQAAKTAAKIGRASFTLEDFLEQMLAIRKMGPIGNILGMLPGANQMKDQLAQVDDRQLDRTAAIIRGMTPAERADPKIINGSRRLRIANGSGVTVGDVNDLRQPVLRGPQDDEADGRASSGSAAAAPPSACAKSRKGKKRDEGQAGRASGGAHARGDAGPLGAAAEPAASCPRPGRARPAAARLRPVEAEVPQGQVARVPPPRHAAGS